MLPDLICFLTRAVFLSHEYFGAAATSPRAWIISFWDSPVLYKYFIWTLNSTWPLSSTVWLSYIVIVHNSGLDKRVTRQLIEFANITIPYKNVLLSPRLSLDIWGNISHVGPCHQWPLTYFPYLIAASMPEKGEDYQLIANDYQRLIVPGADSRYIHLCRL